MSRLIRQPLECYASDDRRRVTIRGLRGVVHVDVYSSHEEWNRRDLPYPKNTPGESCRRVPPCPKSLLVSFTTSALVTTCVWIFIVR
jgi:hypothetical protein